MIEKRGGGAPTNNAPERLLRKFSGFTLDLLELKRRILSCHPEDGGRRILKKNVQGIFRYAQNDRKCAFTLAEVLITLGVIGIVAAMTLPSAMGKYNEHVTINSLKTTYSILQNAYTKAVAEDGTPDTWTSQSYVSVMSEEFLNKFAKQIRFINLCGRDTSKICLKNRYKTLSGDLSDLQDSWATSARGVMYNGNIVVFYITQANCTRDLGDSKMLKSGCGWVFVDVNGQNKPNQIGRDGFYFWISKYGVIPMGTEAETFETTNFQNSCSDSKTQRGWACAAWVLFNENQDYLRCSDLDWNGKHKCK